MKGTDPIVTATAIASAETPFPYEEGLFRRLQLAFAQDALSSYRSSPDWQSEAKRHAQVAMGVLGPEADNGMAWGVGCTRCAHYLDRLLQQHALGEKLGVELFTRHLSEILKGAYEWSDPRLALAHIEAGLSGFLRRYHMAGPGRTFKTPQSASPGLVAR